jgi:hypothetical protein
MLRSYYSVEQDADIKESVARLLGALLGAFYWLLWVCVLYL